MPVPQITVRLSAERKAELERYCSNVGLNTSELLRLLVFRDKAANLLADFKKVPTRPGQHDKVTAHFSEMDPVSEFDVRARKARASRAQAAAFLIDEELRNRWLEQSLVKRP